jgi:hypothetical protein
MRLNIYENIVNSEKKLGLVRRNFNIVKNIKLRLNIHEPEDLNTLIFIAKHTISDIINFTMIFVVCLRHTTNYGRCRYMYCRSFVNTPFFWCIYGHNGYVVNF